MIRRRDFLKIIGLAGVSLPIESFAGKSNINKRPDVLFISIEDLSPHRMGCYGNTVCRTPNIDRLAAASVRFDLAHCSAAPCNPSRTSLLTGLRPETTRVFGNGDDWTEAVKPGRTMTEHFIANGYETIRVGKIYHAGNRDKTYDDTSRWSRTIKESEGLPAPKNRRRQLIGPGVEYGKKRIADRKKGIYTSSGSPFTYGPSGLDDLEEQDGMSATQAIKVLCQQHSKPLFFAVGFHKPHLPLTAPDKYFAMYPPETMVLPENPNTYPDGMPRDKGKLSEKQPHTLTQWREAIAAEYACVTFIDAQVGRILDALEKSGRADNTIIVLWTDHGFMLGEHFMWRKGPLYDHSALVPLLIKAPGVTKPNSVCKRPVESIDIFPTLFELCGIPIPKGLEAISMVPLLKDPNRKWKKGALTSQGENGKSICTERWRYTEYKNGPEKTELFDRKKDPKEFHNLAKDPSCANTINTLSKLLNGGWKACLPD